MSAPVIPRKPVPAPAQAHMKDVEAAEAHSGRGLNVADSQQKESNNAASQSLGVTPKQLQKTKSKRWLCFTTGSYIGDGSQLSKSGLSLKERFNQTLPPHKKYFGRFSRRTLLIVIGITLLCLLALIIGLAVGLTTGSKKEAKPLPPGTVITGDLTYYSPALGACGIKYTDSDNVVSISHTTFDASTPGTDPNQNPLCGREIRAGRVDERTGQWASIDLVVGDRCTGCKPEDLDVSPTYFDKLASHDLGRVKVKWSWL